MRRRSTIGILVGSAVVLGLACWLIQAISNARELARDSGCRGNLGQLHLALHNYHDTYGRFPPAYLADDAGKPIHSWRVLILPFMDQADVYSQYDFSEPWNGPGNRKLANSIYQDIFHCDSGPHMGESPITDYVLVTGPETVFPGPDSRSIADITDGPENTILLVETADSDIHWMEPRDLDVSQMSFQTNDPQRPSISSPHPRGPAVVFVERLTSWRIPSPLHPETLRSLTTIAGAEPVTRDQLSRMDPHVGRILSD